MNTQSIVQLVQRLVFCLGTAVMQNIQNNTVIALIDTGWNVSCPGTAVEFGVTWSLSFSICWNDTWKWRRSFNKVTFLIICNLSCEGKSYNAGKTCKKDSDLSVFILCTNSEKCAEIETFQPFKWAGQWLFKICIQRSLSSLKSISYSWLDGALALFFSTFPPRLNFPLCRKCSAMHLS